MATTDTELKRLNKTVDEAVNILKMYVGNSAQAKNANEKQNQVFDKLADVNESAEQNQKKQRAFTERTRDENGRFIKKKEAQSNKIMGMAGSVKGMFGGVTKNITSSLSGLASGITQNLQSFFQAVKSQFLSLFGEESEWFDILNSIKDSVLGFAGWFAKGFALIFSKSPTWAKSMVKTLKDIYKLQIRQMKMDFMDASGKNKKGGGGIMSLVAGLIFAIGASIGAMMHRYFIVITKLPIFAKIAKLFSKLDDVPFIGKMLKAIKFGFKWIGWPLTILLSVIDFIKGYKNTEGSMLDKIKEGLWNALEGFIELPVMFIGWVVEKVLGWFGIESEGVGNKIMGIMKNTFTMIIEGWELIFGLLKEGWDNLISADWVNSLFSGIGNFFKNSIDGILSGKWADALFNAITPIVAGVHNFFIDFWNSVVEWISSKIPDWMPGRDKITQGLTSTEMSRMVVPEANTSPIESINNTEKAKIEDQNKKDKLLEDAMKNIDKSVKESGNKTGNAINSLSSVQNGGGGGATVDTQQIPDEIDNILVSVGNYNGGME